MSISTHTVHHGRDSVRRDEPNRNLPWAALTPRKLAILVALTLFVPLSAIAVEKQTKGIGGRKGPHEVRSQAEPLRIVYVTPTKLCDIPKDTKTFLNLAATHGNEVVVVTADKKDKAIPPKHRDTFEWIQCDTLKPYSFKQASGVPNGMKALLKKIGLEKNETPTALLLDFRYLENDRRVSELLIALKQRVMVPRKVKKLAAEGGIEAGYIRHVGIFPLLPTISSEFLKEMKESFGENSSIEIGTRKTGLIESLTTGTPVAATEEMYKALVTSGFAEHVVPPLPSHGRATLNELKHAAEEAALPFHAEAMKGDEDKSTAGKSTAGMKRSSHTPGVVIRKKAPKTPSPGVVTIVVDGTYNPKDVEAGEYSGGDVETADPLEAVAAGYVLRAKLRETWPDLAVNVVIRADDRIFANDLLKDGYFEQVEEWFTPNQRRKQHDSRRGQTSPITEGKSLDPVGVAMVQSSRWPLERFTNITHVYIDSSGRSDGSTCERRGYSTVILDDSSSSGQQAARMSKAVLLVEGQRFLHTGPDPNEGRKLGKFGHIKSNDDKYALLAQMLKTPNTIEQLFPINPWIAKVNDQLREGQKTVRVLLEEKAKNREPSPPPSSDKDFDTLVSQYLKELTTRIGQPAATSRMRNGSEDQLRTLLGF